MVNQMMMEMTRQTTKMESFCRNFSSFGPKADLNRSIKLLFKMT